MTTKDYKYLTVVKNFFAADALKNEDGWKKALSDALAYDYATAVLLWEYVLTENEAKMGRPEYARVYADIAETLFEKKNAARLAKTINESAPVRNALYRYSATAFGRTETIGYLVALLTGGKIEEADEIIKCALKNTCSQKTFGAFLLSVVDRVIIELLKKNSVKTVMPKKLSAFLLDYAAKIKSPEGALITQKIRELA